jgi:hypothetical protein
LSDDPPRETVWKYPLSICDVQTISVPRGSEFLSIQNQNDALVMWRRVSPNAPLEDLMLEITGTGHPMVAAPRRYLATVQDGSLVWHVWEIPQIPSIEIDVAEAVTQALKNDAEIHRLTNGRINRG